MLSARIRDRGKAAVIFRVASIPFSSGIATSITITSGCIIGMGYFTDCQPDFTILNELGELYAEMGQPVAANTSLMAGTHIELGPAFTPTG